MAAPLINPQVPLLVPIPGGFMRGRAIRIQGSTSPAAQRFAINLQCGANCNPRDDLALHLNPRFMERVIGRNSLMHGQWGHEENHGGFPLIPGHGFEIMILCEMNSYKVAINGQHFAEFHHRMQPERVTYLSVDGDVILTAVYFDGGATMGPGFAPTMPLPGTVPHMPMPGAPQGGHYPTYPHGSHGVPHVPGGAHYPQHHGHGVHHSSSGHHNLAYGAAGVAVGLGAAHMMSHLSPKSMKKEMKKQRKAHKKAMKHGHHGGYHKRGSSSSSSSSSSSEEE